MRSLAAILLFACSAFGQTRVIPEQVRGPGSYTQQFTLKGDTVAVVISMPRAADETSTTFDDASAQAGVAARISYDKGKTFEAAGGFTAFGGVHIRRDGTKAAASYMRIPLRGGSQRILAVDLTTDKSQKLAVDVEEIAGARGQSSRFLLAIAYDSGGSTSSAANVSSLTTASFTIAGSNRLLMGGIMSGAGTPVNPSGMKWEGSGGTALTQRGATVNAHTFVKVSQFSLVAPNAASGTGYGNWPSNQDETAIGFASYTDVDQSTPHGTQVTATGASTTATVNVSSAVGELVSDVVAFIDTGGIITSLTVGASQTDRVNIPNVGGITYEAFGMSDEAGATTVTMSWTAGVTGFIDGWGILGIPIKPAGGAGPVCTPRFTLLGVGGC